MVKKLEGIGRRGNVASTASKFLAIVSNAAAPIPPATAGAPLN